MILAQVGPPLNDSLNKLAGEGHTLPFTDFDALFVFKHGIFGPD